MSPNREGFALSTGCCSYARLCTIAASCRTFCDRRRCAPLAHVSIVTATIQDYPQLRDASLQVSQHTDNIGIGTRKDLRNKGGNLAGALRSRTPALVTDESERQRE
jgi:hypothetical protein